MSAPAKRPAERTEEDVALSAAVREGIADADDGRVGPFEPVAHWLASWGREDERPLPE